MEKRIAGLKLVATALLVVAFFLPLSRCARPTGQEAGTVREGEEPLPPAPAPAEGTEKVVYELTYAWTDASFGAPRTWLPVVAFWWPIPFLVLGRRRGLGGALLLGIQPLLAAGTLYVVYAKTLFGELLSGGYLAYAGAGLYLAASLWGLVCALWSGWKGHARRTVPSHAGGASPGS